MSAEQMKTRSYTAIHFGEEMHRTTNQTGPERLSKKPDVFFLEESLSNIVNLRT